MGYTTRFEGKFDLSRQLTLDEFNTLDGYHFDEQIGVAGSLHGYMQWVPTKDGRGIVWDGEEKFYDYDKWLKLLIDSILKPMGVKVSGSVKWQGEEADDRGVLSVVDGVVTATRTPPAGTKVKCPECGHHFYVETK